MRFFVSNLNLDISVKQTMNSNYLPHSNEFLKAITFLNDQSTFDRTLGEHRVNAEVGRV